MDLSWLYDAFLGLANVFKPLEKIAHWRIWAAIWDLINRLRNWYKWYQQNVQQRMQRIRALYKQLFDRWVQPILKIVDTIRRLTGVVGLFNQKLANKLNVLFLRVEGYLLEPLNTVIARINRMERIFSGFLTPFGYLDRATLLNSFWRDLQLFKQLWSNPFSTSYAVAPTPPPPAFSGPHNQIVAYVQGQPTPIKSDVDASVAAVRQDLGLA